jgi:hypothetical protein
MDCQAYLQSLLDRDPYLSSIYVTMVTLNRDDVASYTETRLYYLPAVAPVGGVSRPGRFTTLAPGSQGIDQPKFDFGLNVQVFSDRLVPGQPNPLAVGLPHRGRQKFDENQADSLALEITDTSPVRITVKLRSWNNTKSTFEAVCEEDGFVYGSTPDVKYILRITKWPPPNL